MLECLKPLAARSGAPQTDIEGAIRGVSHLGGRSCAMVLVFGGHRAIIIRCVMLSKGNNNGFMCRC